MGIRELRSCREQLEGYLVEPDDESKYSFAGMLGEGMQALDVDARELCMYFDVSVPTVGRWLAGRTAPVPWYRRLVANQLLELVDNQLASSSQSASSSSQSASAGS